MANNITVFPKILIKQNDFDYVKMFKLLYYNDYYKILNGNKIEYNECFNIVISDKKDVDTYSINKSNELTMFRFVNKRFNKLFILTSKSKIAKITKKYTKMYINNLYDKVKFNILDYTTGDIITDVIDTIDNSVLNETYYVSDLISRISKKIENEFLNTNMKICFASRFDPKNFNGTVDSIKTINQAFEYIGKIYTIDTSSNHRTIIKKYVNNLVKFNVLQFINEKMLKWCKNSKKFNYINTDSKLFFNRLSSSVIEQKVDFEEIMKINNLKSKLGINKKVLLRSISNAVLSNLNTIISSIEHKVVIDDIDLEIKCNYKSICSNFDSAFENFKHCLDFFNNVTSTVKYTIQDIEMVNRNYDKIRTTFIDKIVDLIKISYNYSEEMGSIASEDIIIFLKAIKKSFRFSSLCSVVRASKIHNFDKGKYKKGLFRDFMQSKSLKTRLKSINLSECEDKTEVFVNNFVDKVWETIYSFVGFDKQENKPIIYTDLMTTIDDMSKLSQYIENLSLKYRNTDSYEIAMSYIFNGQYLSDDGDIISPFVKLDSCYYNFIN